MKIGIMQPYFFPYIGYFQLIAAVDKFIIYDNIKYTKKGWINRNRMLQNGADKVFSVALVKGSDELDIIQRIISPEFKRDKLLSQLKGCYLKASYFKEVWPLIQSIILYQDENLFFYIRNSINQLCDHLDINTEIITSSCVQADHSLSSQERVLSICMAMNATTYINPIGGTSLYTAEDFLRNNVELRFIESKNIKYPQFDNVFLPSLSIIDVLMFNSKEQCKQFIFSEYELR